MFLFTDVGLTAVQCDQPIASESCRSRLAPHYTQSRMPVIMQSLLGNVFNADVLLRLDQCSNGEGGLFVCSSTIAGCQDNGLPIMPCKHLCQSEYRFLITHIEHIVLIITSLNALNFQMGAYRQEKSQTVDLFTCRTWVIYSLNDGHDICNSIHFPLFHYRIHTQLC